MGEDIASIGIGQVPVRSLRRRRRGLQRQNSVGPLHTVENSVVLDDMKEDPEISIPSLTTTLERTHPTSSDGCRKVLDLWVRHTLTDTLDLHGYPFAGFSFLACTEMSFCRIRLLEMRV